MKTLPALLFALAAVAAFAADSPPEHQDQVKLATWGMPGSPRYQVLVLKTGGLEVVRESLPITKEGLTKKKVNFEISAEQAAELIDLAVKAIADFDEGCMTVGDGTSARMGVWKGSFHATAECSMAEVWPTGEHASVFIKKLNDYLPKEMQVY